jgi:hypothetical protein
MGIFEHSGPYFPTLEQQARRLAYAWSGRIAMPTEAAMDSGIAACQARRGTLPLARAHIAAPAFAREAGVEPDPAAWPGLERALLYGPLSPASFRLGGPDLLPGAAARVAVDAAAFGAVPDGRFSEVERDELRTLAAAGGHAGIAALVAALS